MDLIKISIFLIVLIKCINKGSACPPGMKWLPDKEGIPECFSCRECPAGIKKIDNCTYEHDTVCDECTDDEYIHFHYRSQQCKTCTVCDAGLYITRNCTNFKDAECDVCPSGTYSDDQNSSTCSSCSKCTGTQVLFKNCTNTEDTKCVECSDGQYYNSTKLLCKKCDFCGAGYYVKRNCSTLRDTECDVCPIGTFSSVLNSSTCSNCTKCNGAQIEIGRCNRTTDTLCERIREENGKHYSLAIVLACVNGAIEVFFLIVCVVHANRYRMKKRNEVTENLLDGGTEHCQEAEATFDNNSQGTEHCQKAEATLDNNYQGTDHRQEVEAIFDNNSQGTEHCQEAEANFDNNSEGGSGGTPVVEQQMNDLQMDIGLEETPQICSVHPSLNSVKTNDVEEDNFKITSCLTDDISVISDGIMQESCQNADVNCLELLCGNSLEHCDSPSPDFIVNLPSPQLTFTIPPKSPQFQSSPVCPTPVTCSTPNPPCPVDYLSNLNTQDSQLCSQSAPLPVQTPESPERLAIEKSTQSFTDDIQDVPLDLSIKSRPAELGTQPSVPINLCTKSVHNFVVPLDSFQKHVVSGSPVDLEHIENIKSRINNSDCQISYETSNVTYIKKTESCKLSDGSEFKSCTFYFKEQ